MVVLLKWKGKCSCGRAKLAHVGRHLPPASLHDADEITQIIRSIWRALLHRFQQERPMVLIILREAGAVGPAFAAEIQTMYEQVISGLTFYAQQWMLSGQLRPLNVRFVGWVVLGMAERAAYFVASSQETLDLDQLADELTQFELYGLLHNPSM